jgi:hypothetical protein
MNVDISKIKLGDMVTLVPLEVAEDPTGSGYIRLVTAGSNSFVWFEQDQIAAHHPAPRKIGVGDRVRSSPTSVKGTVEHITRGKAWVVWDACYETVWNIADLILVEKAR